MRFSEGCSDGDQPALQMAERRRKQKLCTFSRLALLIIFFRSRSSLPAPYGVYHIQRAAFSRTFVKAVFCIWRPPYPASGTLTKPWEGSAPSYSLFRSYFYYKSLRSLSCTAETHTPHCNIFHLLLYCVALRSSSGRRPKDPTTSKPIIIGPYLRTCNGYYARCILLEHRDNFKSTLDICLYCGSWYPRHNNLRTVVSRYATV
jgi:hypothetical protein